MNLSIVSHPLDIGATFQVIDNTNKVLFVGTYTQCLIYVGGLSLVYSHDDSTNIAYKISIE